ncbi:tyrosine-type recombinase/integrase [Rhizobium herbae]|uniref:Integrase n=1 Tax=Rhizobium herbae TaxID=508661 RepID=A0ABS4EFP6_9HYPH|nr:site-specific integrase [Rhizobium herbae]MBP1856763.1 integrase [Rhizobium herbae]
MATITKRHWTTSKGEEREAWVLAYTDKQGKRHKENHPKKKEAEARRIEVEGQISKGAFRVEAAKKTVGDAIDAYAKALDKRLKEGSATRMYTENTKGQLNTHVRPTMGNLKLAETTARNVTALIDTLKDNSVGLPTIRRVIGALSRTLQYAVQQDMVAGNVAKGVRVLAARGETNKRIVPPSKDEFAAILKAADEMPPIRSKQPPALALRIRFAARTGLRASEQWALRWMDVDLQNGLVTVSRRLDAFGQIDVTKTEAGRRTVNLSKTLIAGLSAWREETRYKGDDDFIFPDARGGFTRHTNFVKRFWIPLLKVASVDVGWHSLRHFAVTTWIESGLGNQPKAIQTLAGHATFHITMSRYGHLFPSADHAKIFDMIDE